ncbi:hypothetical protein PSAB_03945 [Paenibacillus sabinae T27]|uniref:Uncharacterized protein n=1 Tax=Paenibacillus sabinae T27 TaxID=1268072 RepID=X4ZG67_9BACL|nr:hypothetical protein PSAB_03945 [Paenibacillus sabinae T27]
MLIRKAVLSDSEAIYELIEQSEFRDNYYNASMWQLN